MPMSVLVRFGRMERDLKESNVYYHDDRLDDDHEGSDLRSLWRARGVGVHRHRQADTWPRSSTGASRSNLDQRRRLPAHAGRPVPRSLRGGLLRPHKWPVLGSDLAGVVESVGSDVTELAVGDRVFGDSFPDGRAAFAQYVCVRPSSVAPIPDGLTSEEAAAVPLAAITALQAIRDLGQVEPGQSVLIHGAGGGVGTMAVQLAKVYGADVTAVCGPGSTAVVESAGADRIIDYTIDDIGTKSETYDLILGINGHQKLSTYRRLLNDGGQYVTIGGTGRTFFDALVVAKIAFMFSGKKASILAIDDDKRAGDLRELHELLSSGRLRPFVDRTFPLEQAAAAMRYVETGHVPGKVVLTIDA